MATNVLPEVRALMICDAVCIDQTTRKFYLLGLIGEFFSGKFPSNSPPFSIFFELTELLRPMRISIRLSDLNDERAPIFEFAQDSGPMTPDGICRGVFQFPAGTPMPH